MQQIRRKMEMIHLTIGWRRDERGTHKHTRLVDSLICIKCSLQNNAFSVPHYVMAALHYDLCYIDSRFFLPLEQLRTVLLGCCLAASVFREAARWQLFYFIFNVNYNKKDLIRSGTFPHLTRTFYIQFSFSFKSRKSSLRNLCLNQFTLAL